MTFRVDIDHHLYRVDRASLTGAEFNKAVARSDPDPQIADGESVTMKNRFQFYASQQATFGDGVP